GDGPALPQRGDRVGGRPDRASGRPRGLLRLVGLPKRPRHPGPGRGREVRVRGRQAGGRGPRRRAARSRPGGAPGVAEAADREPASWSAGLASPELRPARWPGQRRDAAAPARTAPGHGQGRPPELVQRQPRVVPPLQHRVRRGEARGRARCGADLLTDVRVRSDGGRREFLLRLGLGPLLASSPSQPAWAGPRTSGLVDSLPSTVASAPPTIRELAREIRKGAVSPVELVRECLARIERLNPKTNAFITVLAESALADARAAVQELRSGTDRGPLHGVPMGLKDIVDTAGIRTTAASAQYKDRAPDEDAEIVRRLPPARP